MFYSTLKVLTEYAPNELNNQFLMYNFIYKKNGFHFLSETSEMKAAKPKQNFCISLLTQNLIQNPTEILSPALLIIKPPHITNLHLHTRKNRLI